MTYTYECSTCGETHEAEQKISEPPLEHCPTPGCPGKPKRVIVAGATFVLKGTGWYRDGYK